MAAQVRVDAKRNGRVRVEITATDGASTWFEMEAADAAEVAADMNLAAARIEREQRRGGR